MVQKENYKKAITEIEDFMKTKGYDINIQIRISNRLTEDFKKEFNL